MLIEGAESPRFSFKFAPDMAPDEWAEMGSAICRILVAGPPPSPARRRAVCVRQLLALFDGAATNRAQQLEARYKVYLSSAWRREQAIEVLSEPRDTRHVLLHRLGRLNAGKPLGWRSLFNIATSEFQ